MNAQGCWPLFALTKTPTNWNVPTTSILSEVFYFLQILVSLGIQASIRFALEWNSCYKNRVYGTQHGNIFGAPVVKVAIQDCLQSHRDSWHVLDVHSWINCYLYTLYVDICSEVLFLAVRDRRNKVNYHPVFGLVCMFKFWCNVLKQEARQDKLIGSANTGLDLVQ